MHIIGTAGHVDHGKSALVQALTGINPDRWLEEQLRGMTLDLGFAPLRFDDGLEAGIVDVPGHERFLHNMLAGASGMELLVLAVAADEGVMPQTIEHLQILCYLNVRRTIVAVTKSDLLQPEELKSAMDRIAGDLGGSIAASAPLCAVSSRTGSGLEDLRRRIHDDLAQLPSRDVDAPAFLPIDRVFSLPGYGTIVTGTLMQGRIERGEQLRLHPSGKPARVRSLQVFGRSCERVEAGARVAANLPGIESGAIGRGEMLAAAQLKGSDRFTVAFRPLPESADILKQRNDIRAYIGSAEILGTLLLDRARDGDSVGGTLALRRATVAYPGMPFVVRRLSPKTLLGGGLIERSVDSVAPAPSPVRDRCDAVLAGLRAGSPQPLTVAELAQAANLRQDAASAAVSTLLERGEIVRLQRPETYLDARVADEIVSSALTTLRRGHGAEPWALGMTSLALSRSLRTAEPLLIRILQHAVDEGRMAHRDGYYAAPEHSPALTAQQKAFFHEVIPVDAAQPLRPTSAAEIAAAVKQSSVAGVGKACDTLFARGALVKVGDHVYRGTQIAQIRARVEEFIRSNGAMTAAQFRDLLGTSRKYAVPLLEWLDARGITVRSGDLRMLRRMPTRESVSP